MKKVLLVIFAGLLIGAGIVASALPWQGVMDRVKGEEAGPEQTQSQRQSGRVIPVVAVKYSNGDNAEADTPCEFLSRGGPGARLSSQVVVTDQAGAIVGMSRLEGGLWVQNTAENRLDCIIESAVSVPDSAFYTIHVDGERYRTLSAQDFPLANPLTVVNEGWAD